MKRAKQKKLDDLRLARKYLQQIKTDEKKREDSSQLLNERLNKLDSELRDEIVKEVMN